ncbi:hypothetical protein EFB08_23270 [Rufibacter latericius]|uniref:Uncharacterized protein n=1 Tax=Rufibacter latericius TaxID=2487040 RepID=A0A3M9M984_9BACT|nr:hypothetical protein EFB08_23270 [Rufibacter latericius]
MFYSLELKEKRDGNKKIKEVSFNAILQHDKIKKNTNLIEILTNFQTETRIASNYRNNITHSYPDNFPNHRIQVYKDESGNKKYGFHSGEYTKASIFIKNTYDSLQSLYSYINNLKVEFSVATKG